MIDRQETRTDAIAAPVGPSDSRAVLVNDGTRAAEPTAFTLPAPSAAAQQSTVEYLALAERTAALMGMAWKVCVALAVLVLAAWVAGILPGAVRII